MLETLTAIRRAGADIVITYHAKEAAEWLLSAPSPSFVNAPRAPRCHSTRTSTNFSTCSVQVPAHRTAFEQVAVNAGMTEDEVMSRTNRLLDDRIIREITPIFDTPALGYDSMLVAAKVDAGNPHRAAHVINEHPGVSHNYLRNHEFNLWFTIANCRELEARSGWDACRLEGAERRRIDSAASDDHDVQDQHELLGWRAGQTSSPRWRR